jgi:hypothetical protein
VHNRVVTSLDDLNFVFRRFGNHIRLRVSPDALLARTPRVEMHVAASISYTSEGRGKILGIGGEGAGAANSITLQLFTASGLASPDYDELLDKFLRVLFRRLHRSGVWWRPVVILAGLNSLGPDVSMRARESLVRALANAGAAAVVLDPRCSKQRAVRSPNT